MAIRVDCTQTQEVVPEMALPRSPRCQWHFSDHQRWRNRLDSFKKRQREKHPNDPDAGRTYDAYEPPPGLNSCSIGTS